MRGRAVIAGIGHTAHGKLPGRSPLSLTVEATRNALEDANVEKDAVITAKDVETIYEVPIVFRKEGLDELIVRQLRLQTGPPNLREWDAMVQKIKHPKHEIAVALVGGILYIGFAMFKEMQRTRRLIDDQRAQLEHAIALLTALPRSPVTGRKVSRPT